MFQFISNIFNNLQIILGKILSFFSHYGNKVFVTLRENPGRLFVIVLCCQIGFAIVDYYRLKHIHRNLREGMTIKIGDHGLIGKIKSINVNRDNFNKSIITLESGENFLMEDVKGLIEK